MLVKNIIIGQSGGPTAAINSTLAGIFNNAKKNNVNKIFGMLNGIEGLIKKNIVDLKEQIKNEDSLQLLIRTPSSFLGSCRYKLPSHKENNEIYKKIFNILEELNIHGFFYIGGNDSMDTIKKLSSYAKDNKKDIIFIGVPKTIDNDLNITDHTPGFGSALKYIATSLKEIIKDASVYNKKSVTIIEIMGRNAGWLTAGASLTKGNDCPGVDLIYLPEITFDIDKFIEKIKLLQKTKKNIIVAISEGIKNKDGKYICEKSSKTVLKDSFGHNMLSGASKILSQIVHEKLGCKTRAIELNTLQRCASHFLSKTDIDESFKIGEYSFNLMLKGLSENVAILKRICNNPYKIEISHVSVDLIANIEKTVPLNWINSTGDYISNEFIEYLKPLINGEVFPIIEDGLPKHLILDLK